MFDQLAKSTTASFVTDNIKAVHKSFEGNSAYRDALQEFRGLDWSTVDFATIQDTAKRITKKAAGEGLKVGAQFLGEAMMEWGVAIGITTGSPATGGLMAAIGAALDWGTDMLYDMLWPETEVYKPGDLVVINKTGSAIPDKEGLRRRLPGEIMSTGMVVGEAVDGKAEVYDFERAVNSWIPVQDLKGIPAKQVESMRAQSAKLRNVQDTVRQLAKGSLGSESVYTHSTRVGDTVEHEGQRKEIVDVGGGFMRLEGERGDQTVVNLQHSGVKDVYSDSSEDVARGQIVWIHGERNMELAIVQGVERGKWVTGVSLWSGAFFKATLDQTYSSAYSPQQWPRFAQAVLERDEHTWMDNLPSKNPRWREILETTPDLVGDPLGPPFQGRADLVGETTSDDFQLEVNHPEILYPEYQDPKYFYQKWKEPEPGEPKASSNAALILAGAACLAYVALS